MQAGTLRSSPWRPTRSNSSTCKGSHQRRERERSPFSSRSPSTVIIPANSFARRRHFHRFRDPRDFRFAADTLDQALYHFDISIIDAGAIASAVEFAMTDPGLLGRCSAVAGFQMQGLTIASIPGAITPRGTRARPSRRRSLSRCHTADNARDPYFSTAAKALRRRSVPSDSSGS